MIGVGLVSVATLFPLSVLRSVQANKITQATVLRYSAEALIDSLDLANAQAFFGPDGRPDKRVSAMTETRPLTLTAGSPVRTACRVWRASTMTG